MVEDWPQLAAARQEDRRLAPQELGDGAFRFGRDEILAADACQFTAQSVERVDAALVAHGGIGLAADATRERRDAQAHQQHDSKRKKVLRVLDGDGVVRLGEDHVEQHDGQDRGDDRRPAPVAKCDEHDPQQIGHHQVGLGQAEPVPHKRDGGARGQHNAGFQPRAQRNAAVGRASFAAWGRVSATP